MTNPQAAERDAVRRAYAKWAEHLPPPMLESLRELHDLFQFDCCGYNEGMWCCVDHITGASSE